MNDDIKSVQFDPDGSTEMNDAFVRGISCEISAGVLTPTTDPIFRYLGPCDRVHISVKEITRKSGPEPTWPFTISWMLGQGAGCVIDRRYFLSGAVPDEMILTGTGDVRTGLLYHAANMLVGQWDLYAFLPVGYAGKYTVKLSVLADWKGGGGKPECTKGRLFG